MQILLTLNTLHKHNCAEAVWEKQSISSMTQFTYSSNKLTKLLSVRWYHFSFFFSFFTFQFIEVWSHSFMLSSPATISKSIWGLEFNWTITTFFLEFPLGYSAVHRTFWLTQRLQGDHVHWVKNKFKFSFVHHYGWPFICQLSWMSSTCWINLNLSQIDGQQRLSLIMLRSFLLVVVLAHT